MFGRLRLTTTMAIRSVAVVFFLFIIGGDGSSSPMEAAVAPRGTAIPADYGRRLLLPQCTCPSFESQLPTALVKLTPCLVDLAGRCQTLAKTNSTFLKLEQTKAVMQNSKNSILTTNQAIFQALDGEDSVHIIDLDVMQGLQWPGLFHILASRPRAPIHPHHRVRAILRRPRLHRPETRRFRGLLVPPFEFHPIVGKIGNVTDPSRLGTRPGEAVVVHWMHHRLYDVTGSDFDTLEVIRRLRPNLVTMVEQELSYGDGGSCFLGRFVEALHYYSALFDALGDGLGEESGERFTVEQIVLATEIRNIVGGRRRGMILRWKEELSRVGFRPVSLRGNPATQAGLLLGMLPWNGYTLVEENGTLRLGWKDLSLLTASAWQSQPSD
ncbi:hypothetical protein Bca52824_027679 [Brassica carinata]|uniref:Uncharacterized protein n=1 Tax=Brassica carinata TaxID=52824 RepID=A0A8X7VAW5_BRACI|nr:hypothetical protein Bca52824_027679 [Brassica carinata]